MKTCICTVIKNEHQYLDEWIQYHLNLGIDYIFIFEDIDSKTHKSITDKYKLNVSLNSINVVLDNVNLLLAKSQKKQKRFNAQHIYFKNAIKYILQNYNYDWCFVIDSDEFITISDSITSLTSVLDLYKDYDAFTLSWKCYGASGHINKPDYKNGVIGAYTQEISGEISDNPVSFRKTCYNLNTYKNGFMFNQHYPTDSCNWVNSDFIKDKISLCYKNIYIRHYITKSWEEYKWKLKERGFMWGRNRGIDFFFTINSDMKDKREELVNTLEDEVLVMLPYIQSFSLGNELELALLGWQKFCTFKYHLVVIGEFDDDIVNKFQDVEFIKCERVTSNENQYIPHLDVLHKMEIIMNLYNEKYRGFIRMMDDIYAVKPFSFNDILTPHYNGEYIIAEENSVSWNNDKWKAKQILKKMNLPVLDYGTHYPSFFEFEKLQIIWDIFNMRNESYSYEDIYFNYFPHEEPILASKSRLGIWSKTVLELCFNTAVNNPNIKFMCNSMAGWSKDVEDKIYELVK